MPQITGLPPPCPDITNVSVVQSPRLLEAKAASETVDGPLITNVCTFEIIKILVITISMLVETSDKNCSGWVGPAVFLPHSAVMGSTTLSAYVAVEYRHQLTLSQQKIG